MAATVKHTSDATSAAPSETAAAPHSHPSEAGPSAVPDPSAPSGVGVSATSASWPDCFIRFRLSHLDYVLNYQHSCYDNRRSPFFDKPLRAVPEIRIFGKTDRGIPVVAHVHGAFPYVFVEYKGENLDPESVNTYIAKLAVALNRALALSLPHKHKKGEQAAYVPFVCVAKAIPFYGYAVGERPFLKIYGMPRTMKRTSEILRSGAVFDTPMDVFEDHYGFIHKFMLDMNLAGAGWVEVSDCLIREGVPEHQPTDSDEYDPPSCAGDFATRLYDSRTVPPSRLHPSPDDGGPTKISYAPLEIDLPISAILNRRRLQPNPIHHDFVELLKPDLVAQGRKVASVKELWLDEARRRAARGENGPYDIKDNALREYDARPPGTSNFIVEPGHREKLTKRVAEDLLAYRQQMRMGARGEKEPQFETYIEEWKQMMGKKSGWLDRIKTAFDQIDAVFIERFEEDERTSYPYGAWAVKGVGLAISREQEEEWLGRGGSATGVDLAKLKASQAAGRAARSLARQRAELAGEDLDDDDDSQEDDLDGSAPRPTQAESLARSQRVLQRNERRGRLGHVEEGAWDQDVAEEREEDDYWGMDHGTDRAFSEAPFGGSEYDSDEASSVASRPNSVSPVKLASSASPAKRPASSPSSPLKPLPGVTGARESTASPIKRFKSDHTKGTLPHASSTLAAETYPPTQTRATPSPTSSYTLSRRQTSSSVTPTRRPRVNPFSSPDKAVSVRVAQPSPLKAAFPPDGESDASALFTFQQPLAKEEGAATDGRQLQNTSLATALPRDAPPPLEHFLQPSPDAEECETASPRRSPSPMTPSLALIELEDLPEGAFEDDYQPTPTIREDTSSQVPDELRSSSDFRLAVQAQEAEDEEDIDDDGPHQMKTDSSLEHTPTQTPPLVQEEDLKPDIPPTSPHKQKKRVAFQLSRSVSQTLSTDSQAKTPTPASASTATPEPESKDVPGQSSQTSTDSNPIHAQPPPTRRLASGPLSQRSFVFAEPPPSTSEVIASLDRYQRSRVRYQDPFYSKTADVPRKVREYAGRRFPIEGSTIAYLAPFQHAGEAAQKAVRGKRPVLPRVRKVRTWEFAAKPPSRADALDWLRKNGEDGEEAKKLAYRHRRSQIEVPTQHDKKNSFTSTKGGTVREAQHMDVLSIEVLVTTRANPRKPGQHYLPDPQEDAIQAIFYTFQSDSEDLVVNGRSGNTHVGVIAIGEEDELRRKLGTAAYTIETVEDERELVELLIEKVRFEWDPDCFAGYEVHHSSWGYLLERANHAFDWNLVPELGRVKAFDTGKFGDKQSDRWGMMQTTTLNFSGRHVLSLFRILSADNKLQQYSFEHVVHNLLSKRVHHLSFKTLTECYTSGDATKLSRVFEYWRDRVELNIELLQAAEIIDQTCESARVFGVDFNSVRTRGSQHKVESVLHKTICSESFMLLSPNRQQVGKQNAAECQPLIMEPTSAFYKGPLLVLDFQSLYPSIMIAYNYCYSTCLGRVDSFKGSYKLGVSESDLPDGLLYLLKDHITISPNGIMFVKPEVRKSALAKMLTELLDTRVMVKDSMKGIDDPALIKLLNARQLALKFLANVTYGYTSATFSGRMPMVEIADAIVQTGRETLERARDVINSHKAWGAQVVYGDTDSLFIYLPGKTKDDAFRIGYEMADTITQQNPRPVKLKFEKVYLPCVLLAKKRYVGWKYEKPSQKDPDFDAKGIETVRRDGIPATQKMQEWCLKSLFRNQDLSLIKEFVQRQWRKIESGDISPQDFIIAKGVKLGSYAEGRLPPPGAAVATRAMVDDPRAEPEYGERVPYLMFQAEPGQKQVHRAISPADFLAEPRLRLDATHYITRMIIPPLERIFNLMGVDVKSWYREMSKSKRVLKSGGANGIKPVMLDEHFISDRCIACNGPKGNGGLCSDCLSHPAQATFTLQSRKKALQQRQRALRDICVSCSNQPIQEVIQCDSIDCPNLYARVRNQNELAKLPHLSDLDF
ncbi:hypothetical protein JCM11641_007531 [Rhodosporidiobolus odoratus]